MVAQVKEAVFSVRHWDCFVANCYEMKMSFPSHHCVFAGTQKYPWLYHMHVEVGCKIPSGYCSHNQTLETICCRSWVTKVLFLRLGSHGCCASCSTGKTLTVEHTFTPNLRPCPEGWGTIGDNGRCGIWGSHRRGRTKHSYCVRTLFKQKHLLLAQETPSKNGRRSSLCIW